MLNFSEWKILIFIYQHIFISVVFMLAEIESGGDMGQDNSARRECSS